MDSVSLLSFPFSFSFSKGLPILVHVDDILFRKPVEIGSLLYFSSQVKYNVSRNYDLFFILFFFLLRLIFTFVSMAELAS